MHEAEVIHRDIKPDNLVISQWKPAFQVKICDFGEAERKGANDHNGYIGGTEGYCSPEYISGSTYGPWIDIWSLGITMYELLFGVLPFNQEDALHANINMDDRELSVNGRDLIMKMLEKNPAERINASGVLQHPWIKENTFKTECVGRSAALLLNN